MNVIFSFPRQAAGEERSVHGRGGAVSASGRRAARRVRRRLETGGKTQRTSWSHSLLVEALIIHIALISCVQWDAIQNKYAATTVAIAVVLGLWSAGAVVSVVLLPSPSFLSFLEKLSEFSLH
jgi:hypothetical protein